MKWIFCVLFFLIAMVLSVQGQRDSVKLLLQQIKQEENDSVREILADKIPEFLKTLVYEEYEQGEKLKYLKYVKCVNAKVELFAWAVPIQHGYLFYNWFRFKKNGQIYLEKTYSLAKNKQGGWLYYDFAAFENNKKICYVLLGWRKTLLTNKKCVKIVSLDENGILIPISDLIVKQGKKLDSLEFDYAVEGSMMLGFDAKGKKIIFDHLSPFEKKYEGFFMFYGPDASYDALVLEKGVWEYRENVKY